MLSIVLVVQVLAAIGVIVLVLLQHGKGADMGAAFGSGASGSLFGATGSANFLSRITGVLATVFFVSTLTLSFLSNKRGTESRSVMDQPSTSAPAQPSAAPAGVASDVPKDASKPAEAVAGKPAAPNDVPK